MTNQEKNIELMLKLDEAKGALEVARGAVLESFAYAKTTNDMVMAEARLRDIDGALASLRFEQPDGGLRRKALEEAAQMVDQIDDPSANYFSDRIRALAGD